MRAVDWESPHWGELGHNVHECPAGSWVDDRHEGAS